MTTPDTSATPLAEPPKMSARDLPPLTDGEIAEIEARAAAATEGPWEADGSEIYDAADDWVGESLDLDAPDGGETNARFAAAARTDVPRLVAALRAAREERGQERWRATQELERKTASFDKEIAEAVADIERIAAERDEASRLAKDRLTVIGAIREEQARLRHLAADETEQLRGELHQMRDHSAADLETIRNLRAVVARAEQATADALPLLAAVDNCLRNGSHMNGGNYAFELLCDLLGVDRDALVFDPRWNRPDVDLASARATAAADRAARLTSQVGEALADDVPAAAERAAFVLDHNLADKARQAAAIARRENSDASLFMRALKRFRDVVLAEGGDGSLSRLKPYIQWALSETADVPAAAGEVTP